MLLAICEKKLAIFASTGNYFRPCGFSGLEGLLAAVGLEVTTEGARTGTRMERWRERIQDFRGCNAELRAPNDVQTNEAERRLVLESLRERVE